MAKATLTLRELDHIVEEAVVATPRPSSRDALSALMTVKVKDGVLTITPAHESRAPEPTPDQDANMKQCGDSYCSCYTAPQPVFEPLDEGVFAGPVGAALDAAQERHAVWLTSPMPPLPTVFEPLDEGIFDSDATVAEETRNTVADHYREMEADVLALTASRDSTTA